MRNCSDDVKEISPKEYTKEEVEVKKAVKELEMQRKVLESYVPPTSFLVALEKMPKYAKFMKDLLTNKAKFEETFIVTLNERCPFVLLNKIPLKERSMEFYYTLCYWESGNRLDIGDLKPTCMFIELANKSTQYSKGIAQNVNVQIDKFVFPDDFVISGIEEDYKVLTTHKTALAWKVADIKGISPSFCTHKILMEDNNKPIVQPQRRLNPMLQDVVKEEIGRMIDIHYLR
ncbi:hypothetical protein Tco_1156165 [Tanacetum coccineum]